MSLNIFGGPVQKRQNFEKRLSVIDYLMPGVGVGVGLVTASERIYLGVKLLKDVYNQFECEIRSHSVLELTINRNSTHFMSLFALFALPKKCEQKCEQKCEYSHYSFAPSPEVRTIIRTPILCANGNPKRDSSTF